MWDKQELFLNMMKISMIKKRNDMEKRYQLELRLGLTDDVSLEQRHIYMMEHLEQQRYR